MMHVIGREVIYNRPINQLNKMKVGFSNKSYVNVLLEFFSFFFVINLPDTLLLQQILFREKQMPVGVPRVFGPNRTYV